MVEFETDLFVIGAGSGGVRAARISAGYGAKVMIAEEFRIGGTCVIRGCVPKKLYVYASRFADDFADAQAFGWRLAHKPEFDWPKLVAAKEGEISRLSRIYEANLLKAGVDVFQERAEILGPHHVRLMRSGRVVTARHILVATGAGSADAARHSRRRTCDQLERDFRPAGISRKTRGDRQRLYRGGIRQHFRPARRACHPDVPRRQCFARLR